MTKQTDYDAHQALSRMDVDASINSGIVYLGDEAEDESPHQSLINDMVDFAKGTLILAVCFGVCGFVYGRYF